MDFLRSLTGREGCFEPAESRLDVCFQLHDVWGVPVKSREHDTLCAALLVSERGPSGSCDSNSGNFQRRYYVTPSETCIIKGVSLDATITTRVFTTTGAIADVEKDKHRHLAGEVLENELLEIIGYRFFFSRV